MALWGYPDYKQVYNPKTESTTLNRYNGHIGFYLGYMVFSGLCKGIGPDKGESNGTEKGKCYGNCIYSVFLGYGLIWKVRWRFQSTGIHWIPIWPIGCTYSFSLTFQVQLTAVGLRMPCLTLHGNLKLTLYNLKSKLLHGGYIEDYIGDYYRGY